LHTSQAVASAEPPPSSRLCDLLHKKIHWENRMKRSLLCAAALSMLAACTTEPQVSVNTVPATVVTPAPTVAVVTPAPPATVVLGAGSFTAVDREFAFNAALSNMLEIGASQMASKHTSSLDVTNLAATINQHHTMAMNDLMALMRARGMAVPGDLSPEKRNLMDKLGGDYGSEYDRDFVRYVGIQAHQQDIAYFQAQIPRMGDPALRDWAVRNLPLMQQHLAMAQDIYGRMAG
jgi:putative membrane protein